MIVVGAKGEVIDRKYTFLGKVRCFNQINKT